MKLYPFLAISTLCLVIAAACRPGKQESMVIDVNTYFRAEADTMANVVQSLADQAQRGASADTLRHTFARARRHFKHIESLVILFFPDENNRMNGPAIVKAEEEDDKIILPTGFQVLEETLYAHGDTINRKKLAEQTLALHALSNNLKLLAWNTDVDAIHAFEAIRLEVLTIISMGISGFDSPISFQSLPEAEAALNGIETIAYSFHDKAHKGAYPALTKVLNNAYQYLGAHTDFDAFDRAAFTVHHLNALSTALYQYQQALNIPNNRYAKAVDLEKSTFFDEHALRTVFFTPADKRDLKPEVVDLGRALFFDPVLSGNNSRACASCHHPDKAFSDGLAKSLAFNFKGQVARNAPTLINSVFQRSQFWDQRTQLTEHQITDVVANPLEMHGHLRDAADKIARSEAYRKLFAMAFDREPEVTEHNIQTALAAYIRSLTSLNAPFDRYMRGDAAQLDADEVAGFNLFMGKGKCGTCHFAPLFNGTVPPLFTETESEVLGVPQKPDTANAVVDQDPGRYAIYARAPFRHAFKTPTLRNAALTAPYMHNGVYRTLEEVVDFYNRGGGAGIGISLENQTLPPDALNLTVQEQRQIVAFIRTLTDTTGLTRTPAALPPFGDKTLDNRSIGGKY